MNRIACSSNRYGLWLVLATLILGHAATGVMLAQDEKKPEKNVSKKSDAKKEIKTFSKSGVSFKFPTNWKVSSDQTFSSTRLIIVDGPNNAIVTIQFTETSVADSLKEYAAGYSKTAAESLPDFRILNQSFGKVSKTRSGYQAISEKFTLADKEEGTEDTVLAHRRVFMKKKFDDYSCFLVTQVATSDLREAKDGFELISKSLKKKTEGDN